MFELIVGIPPFNENTAEEVFKRITARNILEWTYLKTILDPTVIDLIDQLL